ncbi:MAG: transglutaminase-like domain-containing protein [Clostridium sp.]
MMRTQKKNLFFHIKTILLALLLCTVNYVTADAANVRTPEASGTVTYVGKKSVIDASHASDGYIMIKYTGENPKIKIRIKNVVEYTYDLNSSGQYETFPLSEGSGTYTVKLFEHSSGNNYAQAVSQSITVNLTSESSPFLYPNQFCNYSAGSAAVSLADTLTTGLSDPLKKVEAIYNYATENITYDNVKAASVQSGYLPNIDATLNQKTGICFDYAAVMTSMLRVEDIPTKLVIGYAGEAYHAWVSVYIQGQGWIDNIIYFDGSTWKFMDPTFASGGKDNKAVQDFIAKPENYRAKFSY